MLVCWYVHLVLRRWQDTIHLSLVALLLLVYSSYELLNAGLYMANQVFTMRSFWQLQRSLLDWPTAQAYSENVTPLVLCHKYAFMMFDKPGKNILSILMMSDKDGMFICGVR